MEAISLLIGVVFLALLTHPDVVMGQRKNSVATATHTDHTQDAE